MRQQRSASALALGLCAIAMLAGCPGGKVAPGGGGDSYSPYPPPYPTYDSGLPPGVDGSINPPPPSCSQPATISGKVFAPNGTDPVPNASVSVRTTPPDPFPAQVACELCSNNNTAGALMQIKSGFDGSFSLSGVCPGNVQIVLQNGRFRRVLPLAVTAGATIALPPDQTRLPRRNAERDPSDSVPKIAVATGDYDQMECVLKRMGLDDDQIEIFDATSHYGAPPTGPSFSQLLADLNRMKQYSVIFINCGNAIGSLLAQPQVRTNVGEYVRSGGRLYVTDLSYDWIEQIPELASALDFEPGPSAPTQPEPMGAASVGAGGLIVDATVKDQQLAQWLGLFPGAIANGRTRIEHFSEGWAMMHQATTNTKVWVEGQVNGQGIFGVRPLTVTFNFNNCGKILFSSYHTASTGYGNPYGPTPGLPLSQRCSQQPLSPQERILEYLIFDIANCVRPIQ